MAIGIAGLLMAVRLIIEVTTLIDDRAELGRPIDPREAWALEGTSFVTWAMLLPLIWLAAARLRPPRLGWPATLAAHVGLSILMSLAHVGLMVGLRLAVWSLAGETYGMAADPLADFLYEYRKDGWTYAVFAGAFAIAMRLSQPAPEALPMPGASGLSGAASALTVSDGARRHHVPVATIDAIEAAGNYVELVVGDSRLLHRATLTALEADLGAAFARIHRSRLVRREAVRLIHANQSGDFEVELAGGTRLKGSRRFRAGLNEPPPP